MHHLALINKITVDDQFKNTDLLIYENFIGKCYQIKDQLLIVIIYSRYRFIYPVNLNYEIVDFRLNFAHVSLLFTFIMRRSAANKVLKKKEQEQPEKNAQKLSAEINSEILFSSPLV